VLDRYAKRRVGLKESYYVHDALEIGCKIFEVPPESPLNGKDYVYSKDGVYPYWDLPTIIRKDNEYYTHVNPVPERIQPLIDEFESNMFEIGDSSFDDQTLPILLGRYKELVESTLASGSYSYQYWKLMGYRSTFYPSPRGLCEIYHPHCKRIIEHVDPESPEYTL